MIERSEKKRPEPSARRVGRTEGLPPQQAGEKLLRRILCIHGSQTASPQLRIHRRPVTPAERFNRPRSAASAARLREHAPVRTGKTRVRMRTGLASFATHLACEGSISSHPAQAPAQPFITLPTDFPSTPPVQEESGRRDSNSRHLPWQGSALPTELRPRNRTLTIEGTPEVAQGDFRKKNSPLFYSPASESTWAGSGQLGASSRARFSSGSASALRPFSSSSRPSWKCARADFGSSSTARS